MYITASSATDIYYLIRKHLRNAEQSKNIMSKLYQLFGVLDVTAKDCHDALVSEVKVDGAQAYAYMGVIGRNAEWRQW